MSIEDRRIPGLRPGYRMQWEPAQQRHVLLYPEGMVKLNGPAAAILEHCDGERDVAAVIAALQAKFGDVDADIDADVREFLQAALENGWIRLD